MTRAVSRSAATFVPNLDRQRDVSVTFSALADQQQVGAPHHTREIGDGDVVLATTAPCATLPMFASDLRDPGPDFACGRAEG